MNTILITHAIAGGMDSWNYYRYQQYYENMRRTDPAAYALWYERYMAEKYGNASNDRASVHSGRSSANEITHSQDKWVTNIGKLWPVNFCTQ